VRSAATRAAPARSAVPRARDAATLVPVPAPEPLPERKRSADAALAGIDDEPVPARGEWVSHKQFGLCRVEGEEESGSLAIRLPSGVRKSISLDFLRVLPPVTDAAGRTVYPLEPRKR
jgi:hypothetical protein